MQWSPLPSRSRSARTAVSTGPPHQAFKPERVKAITFTGYSYFLDVEARKDAPSHPLVVLDDRVPVDAGCEHRPRPGNDRSYDYDDVDLVRFAAQNVYAPLRLIKPLPGVTRVPVPEQDVSALPGS